MGQQIPLIQLLSVPNCPLVAKVRDTLNACLAKTHILATVEELVRDYNSPTLLVNGFDVTGQPSGPDGHASCRLDLPNREQILAAIVSFQSCENGGEANTRVSKFSASRQ